VRSTHAHQSPTRLLLSDATCWWLAVLDRYLHLLESRCPDSPLLQAPKLWVTGMHDWSLDPATIMGKRDALANAILSGCPGG
jgi:hypothetical protein